MTLPTVLAIAGCIALLLGVLGGGIKAKGMAIPKLSTAPRIATSLLGLTLVGIAIWLFPSDPSIAIAIPTSIPVCQSGNLLDCSTAIPIFVDGQSRLSLKQTAERTVVEFDNQHNGSGVALQLIHPLDVSVFHYLEISGTSSKSITFLIEYKVDIGDQVESAMSSAKQTFPATSKIQTIKVPVVYEHTIDEIAINFPVVGDASKFLIESIQLK